MPISPLEKEALIITATRLNVARDEAARLAKLAQEAGMEDIERGLIEMQSILRKPSLKECEESLNASKRSRAARSPARR